MFYTLTETVQTDTVTDKNGFVQNCVEVFTLQRGRYKHGFPLGYAHLSVLVSVSDRSLSVYTDHKIFCGNTSDFNCISKVKVNIGTLLLAEMWSLWWHRSHENQQGMSRVCKISKRDSC